MNMRLKEIEKELEGLREKYGEMLFVGGSFPKHGFDMFKDIGRLLEIIEEIHKEKDAYEGGFKYNVITEKYEPTTDPLFFKFNAETGKYEAYHIQLSKPPENAS